MEALNKPVKHGKSSKPSKPPPTLIASPDVLPAVNSSQYGTFLHPHQWEYIVRQEIFNYLVGLKHLSKYVSIDRS